MALFWPTITVRKVPRRLKKSALKRRLLAEFYYSRQAAINPKRLFPDGWLRRTETGTVNKKVDKRFASVRQTSRARLERS